MEEEVSFVELRRPLFLLGAVGLLVDRHIAGMQSYCCEVKSNVQINNDYEPSEIFAACISKHV